MLELRRQRARENLTMKYAFWKCQFDGLGSLGQGTTGFRSTMTSPLGTVPQYSAGDRPNCMKKAKLYIRPEQICGYDNLDHKIGNPQR